MATIKDRVELDDPRVNEKILDALNVPGARINFMGRSCGSGENNMYTFRNKGGEVQEKERFSRTFTPIELERVPERVQEVTAQQVAALINGVETLEDTRSKRGKLQYFLRVSVPVETSGKL